MNIILILEVVFILYATAVVVMVPVLICLRIFGICPNRKQIIKYAGWFAVAFLIYTMVT